MLRARGGSRVCVVGEGGSVGVLGQASLVVMSSMLDVFESEAG